MICLKLVSVYYISTATQGTYISYFGHDCFVLELVAGSEYDTDAVIRQPVRRSLSTGQTIYSTAYLLHTFLASGDSLHFSRNKDLRSYFATHLDIP